MKSVLLHSRSTEQKLINLKMHLIENTRDHDPDTSLPFVNYTSDYIITISIVS